MAFCNKCASTLVKKKSTMSYDCRHCGFIRKILTPPKTFIKPAEPEKQQ